LWLADAPEVLHNLCFFGLPIPQLPAVAGVTVPPFQLTLGDLYVTHPEMLSDADQALQSAIAIAIADLVESNGGHDETAAERLEAASERVVFVVPEVQESAAKPYVRVIPWSIKPKGSRGGSGELVDNYTVRPLTALAEDAPAAPQWVSMAYQRPTPSEVIVAYAIEVVGRDRLEITTYQSAILTHFSRYPWLMIDGELLGLRPFHPSPEEIANLSATGRNPLFFELSVLVERGDRQPQDQAYPRLVVGDINASVTDQSVQLFETATHP
jgi:hypothetical protein